MTHNDFHDALIILRYVSWGTSFPKKGSSKPLRGVVGESSLEVFDYPSRIGVSRDALL